MKKILANGVTGKYRLELLYREVKFGWETLCSIRLRFIISFVLTIILVMRTLIYDYTR